MSWRKLLFVSARAEFWVVTDQIENFLDNVGRSGSSCVALTVLDEQGSKGARIGNIFSLID
jgi:hypothetical protein